MGKLGKKFARHLNIDRVLSNAELLTVSTLQAADCETQATMQDTLWGATEA